MAWLVSRHLLAPASCLIFTAFLPQLRLLVFVSLGPSTCLVARHCRLPACALWFVVLLRVASALLARSCRCLPIRCGLLVSLACALWFARFVCRFFVLLSAWLPPASPCVVVSSFLCRFVLASAWWLRFLPLACLYLRGLARFMPLRGCICLVARLLPFSCLHFGAWLVSCRFVLVLVLVSWLGFCCFPACTFWSGSLRAASWLYLLAGSLFAAYLPVLCGLAGFPPLYLLCGCLGACVSVVVESARFMPFGACTCFVAGSWRLPACTLALGSFRAVSCLYLLRGWFLALACLCFARWLVPCRFVLVPCFVARFCRLPACSWWVARFRAVSCLHLPTSWLGFGSPACLCFVAWLFFRAVSCLYLLRGSVLPPACLLL